MTQDLFTVLDKLKIAYEEHEHPAVFTVEEANEAVGHLPGGRNKNLFLRDKKGHRHYLVTIKDDKRADLKRIGEILGSDRLSFASPERLRKHLGLTPGSVSPFGLINDPDRHVQVLIDSDLMEFDRLQFHPNDNRATVIVSAADFRRFLEWAGHDVRYERL